MPKDSAHAETRLQLGFTIGQIARRWRACLDQRIAPFGLTEARWLTLLNLARRGDGITQKDLAARLRVEAPTLVRTLDWLERQGFVERRGSTQDGSGTTAVPLQEAERLLAQANMLGFRDFFLAVAIAGLVALLPVALMRRRAAA